MAAVVCPGDKLRHSSEVVAGRGTYVRDSDGAVCASVAGAAVVTAAVAGAAEARPLVEVLRGRGGAALPQAGATVLARVARVTPRLASVDILCVDGCAAERPFSGVIRQQDVRATDVDRVVMHDCFRAGDVVRAAVLSLGDSRAYYLSTARNDLGVASALAATSGETMLPLSWQEMRCPTTGAVEKRKVAQNRVVS